MEILLVIFCFARSAAPSALAATLGLVLPTLWPKPNLRQTRAKTHKRRKQKQPQLKNHKRIHLAERWPAAPCGFCIGAAVASKAGSFNHNWVTFKGFWSQWSVRRASKFAADKSKVATTARLHKVYVYAYIMVADCPPFDNFGLPCSDSRFVFKIIASPTPSSKTPE